MRWCAGPVLPGRVLPDSQSKARIVAWVRRPESIGEKRLIYDCLLYFGMAGSDVTNVTREFCVGTPEAHFGGKMKGSALSARTLPETTNYCCIAAWISVTCRVLVALSRLPLTFTCLPSNCLALSWSSIWYVPVSVFRTYLSPDFTTVP